MPGSVGRVSLPGLPRRATMEARMAPQRDRLHFDRERRVRPGRRARPMWRRGTYTVALAAGVVVGGSAAAGGDTLRLGRYQAQAGGFGGAVKAATDPGPATDT